MCQEHQLEYLGMTVCSCTVTVDVFCWINVEAKLVLVPCGHANLCNSCARACFARVQKCDLYQNELNLFSSPFS